MSRAILPTVSSYGSRATALQECFPLSMWSALSSVKRSWSLECTRTAILGCAAAMSTGGASKVYVPLSLVLQVESFKRNTEMDQSLWKSWNCLVENDSLVLCVYCDESEAASVHLPQFNDICIFVPGGPLISNIEFSEKVDHFYDNSFPQAVAALRRVHGENCTLRVWMRSALSCRYEGEFVPPIRVAERTAAVLHLNGGPSSVVWEQGIVGLTPRWLETFLKTALSVGVPLSRISVALSAGDQHPRLLYKCIEAGLSTFCCSSLEQPCFSSTNPFVSAVDVCAFMEGWNDSMPDFTIDDESEEKINEVTQFKSLLNKEWSQSLLQ